MRRSFGAYELYEELGRGGMGVVYRGVHRGTGQVVALKVLFAHMTDAALLARFEREGLLGRQLQHPAIVRTLDMGQVGGTPFVAFEFVEGETLARAWRGWSMEARVGVVAEVAEAVGVAHGHGVVHRDLKPENVLLERGGRVRLSDFGLAAATRDVGRLTLTGELLGTPAYMAPEQLDGAVKATPQPSMDVWALGVMLYEALTGSVPYEGLSVYELLYKIRAGALPLPRARVPEVPRALEELCLRALDPEPELRPADAEVFRVALRAAMQATATRRRRRSWLRVGVVGVVLAGAASAWWVEGRSRPGGRSGAEVDRSEARREAGWEASRAALARQAWAFGESWFRAGWGRWATPWVRAGAWGNHGDGYDLLGRWALRCGEQEEAFEAFRRGVALGSRDSLAGLAVCYAQGWGVERDPNRALDLMLEAGRRGLGIEPLLGEWMHLGWRFPGRMGEVLGYLESPEREEAIESLLLRAEIYGDSAYGVSSPDHALTMLKRAGDSGSMEACYRLHELYDRRGYREGYAREAMRWLTRAAEQGDPRAFARLAWVRINMVKRRGEGPSRADLEVLRDLLGRPGVTNLALGACALAELWLRGWSAPPEPGAGIAVLVRAVQRGSLDARVQLAMSYRDGLGVERDAGRCEALLVEAAERSHLLACWMLARMHLVAGGVATPDPETGVGYLARAARAGDMDQAMLLASLRARGRFGVAVDAAEARRWVEIAAEAGHPGALRVRREVEEGGYRPELLPEPELGSSLRSAGGDGSR